MTTKNNFHNNNNVKVIGPWEPNGGSAEPAWIGGCNPPTRLLGNANPLGGRVSTHGIEGPGGGGGENEH